MKKIEILFTALMSAFFSSFGLLAIPILLLVGSNVIDYITGLMASSNRKEKVSSYKGIKGIFKKVAMYFLVIIGFFIDVLINYTITNLGMSFEMPAVVSCIVAVWLVCNEIISILENLIDMEVDLPPFVLPLVKMIKGQTEDKISIKEEK